MRSGPLRIALLAAPLLPVPPLAYGGTERVVATLAVELGRRGHKVTVFASGDSGVDADLVPIVPRALWPAGYGGPVAPPILAGVARCWALASEFDLIHSHVEGFGFLLARYGPVPVLSTLHGRLDLDGMPELLEEFCDIPLVAISEAQRRAAPSANWLATIHHGLALDAMPFSAVPDDHLLFVGRIVADKGIADAIAVAAATRLRLKIAAKVRDPDERELFEHLVAPAVARDAVEFLGEVQTRERDALYASARATLMLGAWPEPFGLVAIESLAAGTPVVARRSGALPEIVRDGIDGFVVDDLGQAQAAIGRLDRLDRAEIRRAAIDRFSPTRMADRYEAAYRSLVERSGRP